MVATLYFLTAGLLAAALHRFSRISLAVAGVLVALPLLLTGPALLTNRVYAPVDLAYLAEPLASLARKSGITHVADAGASDAFAQFIPWHDAVRFALSHGQWPLWNPFELSGNILAGASQAAPYHPLHLMALALPLPTALTFIASMLYFCAAAGALLFIRDLTGDDRAASFGAAAWMFSRHLVSFSGTAHALSLIAMPLVLLGARRIALVPSPRSAVILGASLVLLLLGGHPETALHGVTLAVAFYGFELALRRGTEWRRSVACGLAAGMGALLVSAIALLPLVEAIPQTDEFRGRANLVSLRHQPRLLHDLAVQFVPSRLLSSDVSFGSIYVGALVFAPALLALFRYRDRRKWFFATTFAFGLFEGIGTPVLNDALARIPLFDIGANERMIWFASLSLCVLGSLGIAAALAHPRGFLFACVIVAVGLVLALPPFRVVAPLMLAACAAATVRRPRIFAAAMLALLLLQRSGETRGIRPRFERNAWYPPFPGLEIMRAAEPFRIVAQDDLLTPNIAAHYRLEDVRGYQAMTLARYADTYPAWSIRQPVWFNRVDDLSAPMLSRMNVRFAIVKPAAPLPAGWIRRGSFGRYDIAENSRAFPRAFLIRGEGAVQTRAVGTELALTASMRSAGTVEVTEPAWHGWRVTVDGRRAALRIVDHTFLAFDLPAGNHQVRLRYLPQSFVVGAWTSALTVAGLLAAAGSLRMRRWSLQPMPEPAAEIG
jgi:hypothetical protein